MATRSPVSVSAPSRLHFGLISIGDRTTRKFGGAGLMIDQPRTRVTVSSAERLQITTDDSDSREAIHAAVQRWQAALGPKCFETRPTDALPFRVSVSNVNRHSGLGSGTQLAFSVAACLQLATEQPMPSSEEMAIALRRGKRSAIGSYGFLQGGFLVDRGLDGEPVAPLDMRIDFPVQWKIVLIEPDVGSASVHGSAEKALFAKLPGTTQTQADTLQRILKDRLVPAILQHDFPQFANAVTDFGRESGMYYSAAQGGPYASSNAQRMVEKVLRLGTFGVGQSSWGPMLFAISPSEKAANWLVEKLHEDDEDIGSSAKVVSADNVGMRVEKS